MPSNHRTRAEEAAEVAIVESKAALAAAANRAKGMVAEAEAEMKAVSSLAEKRKFELEWKRLEVLIFQLSVLLLLLHCVLPGWLVSLLLPSFLHRQ